MISESKLQGKAKLGREMKSQVVSGCIGCMIVGARVPFYEQCL